MMKKALLFMSVLCMMSCNNKTSQPDNNTTEKTKPQIAIHDIWILKEIDGQSFVSTSNKQPQIEFNVKENTFFGNDGCNQIRGSIKKLTDNELSLGPIMGTRMSCKDTKDKVYQKLLQNTANYTIENLELTLFNSQERKILIFSKGD